MKGDYETMKHKNKFLLKLDLQHFAADPGVDPQESNPTDPPEPGTELKKIELTEEELLKRIESESDKKLEKALKTARTKWEKEFHEKLEQEKKEAERLAKLSEKERKEEEMRKREEELEKRFKELERKELKADAIGVLTEKQLPTNFVDFLLADNAEKTLENINVFKSAFDEAVAAKVKEALAGNPPKKNPSGNNFKNPFSKAHFNLTEQAKLYKENPDLYKQLKAQANQ